MRGREKPFSWDKFIYLRASPFPRGRVGSVLEKLGMAGIPALMGIDISGSLKSASPWQAPAHPTIQSTGFMEGWR